MKGPDHASSIEPNELENLVEVVMQFSVQEVQKKEFIKQKRKLLVGQENLLFLLRQ